MFYVYILQSKKDNGLYFGYTENLRKRLSEHNSGKSFATKSRQPWSIIFYEAYINKYDALRREGYFKTSKGKTTVRQMLREYFVHNVNWQKCDKDVLP